MANTDAVTSSGNAGGGQYQVFLNFHGRDTRDGFTDFLRRDLRNNGIHAFIDNEGLRVGEEIGGALLRAIDDSQIYIPIFSPNYASSKWCLRELKRMVDNQSKSKEKKILPIFYYVKPDDVDLKTESYREAIEELKKEHEKKQQEKFPHEVESWEGEYWEEALKKVDKIKGWVLRKGESQAELVDSVVKVVLQELKIRYKPVTKHLVGLDHRVAEVLKLLDVDCNDEVRLLGIHGMGGIGKTTIAKVVYNELSFRFEKCCTFLDDVRETLKKDGIVWLQKKLLIDIDNSSAAEIIGEVDHGRQRIESALGSKKVLIVLDDVDEETQIENLIGQPRLYPGTRIIITTRDASVPKFTKQRMAPETKEVNSNPAIRILLYEMVSMNFDDALQLFKRHAFCEDSLATAFDNLSRDIVSTTGCLPLALKVTGSSLCGESKEKWENNLEKLKKIPDERVQEKLMISYEDLQRRQQEIFLDIACFFINEDITNAKYMWEACELNPELEIDVLVRKSLIKIKDDKKFWMHDQLRDLGREIVCQQNLTNLRKRSRLWTSKEILDLVGTEERNEYVEALDLQGWGSSISIEPEEIGRFKSLRFLRLYNVSMHGDFIIALPNLKWISWRSPFQIDSVPSMQLKNLVVLELFDNHFKDDSKVWDLIKTATKLKSLALVKCHGITKTPDFSKCLALERLAFDDCWSVTVIDSSITKLTCLLYLELNNFNLTGWLLSNLKILSNLTLRFLQMQEIQLDGLSQLQYLELECCDLRSLSIPSSLRTLKVLYCPNMSEIQFLGTSASLKVLTIEYCTSIGRIVLCSEVGSLGVLNQLESSLRELTYCSPIVHPNALKKLKKLRLKWCENILEIQVIGTLTSLQDIYIENCQAMEKLSGVSNLKNLKSLCINACRKLRFVEGLDELKFLSSLYVSRCPSLETLLDRLNSKISEMCLINVHQCGELLNSSPEGYITFKRYKMMAQQRAPQPETNKEEAKMEGDAVEPDTDTDTELQSLYYSFASSSSAEPDTELQSPYYSSASSSDHEISEEPPIDNVRDGTLPDKQNQMTEQDLNPLNLDELAPPRTFCDRFKTCLASILECVCNCNFPSVKAEIL